MSWLLASGGQSTGALTSVLPMNVQGWFPLGLTSVISLQSKGVFSNTTIQKHQFFSAQLSLWSISHIHTWLLPCVYRGEFGVRETPTLKSTDVFGADPLFLSVTLARPLSCSLELMGRESGDTANVKVASENLLRVFHLCPLSRFCLGVKPHSLSPITENKSLFSSGGQRASPLHPGGERDTGLPWSPTVGREHPGCWTSAPRGGPGGTGWAVLGAPCSQRQWEAGVRNLG